MRNAKSTITRLKNTINDTLPDDQDIYGFKGVNKILISDALQESYNLISMMENSRTSFDVICLKRNITTLTDKCNEILKTGLEFNRENNFNELLDYLSQIRKNIKETYLLFIENSLITAAQAGKLKEDIRELSSTLTEYQETKEKIDKTNTKINEISQELIDFYNQYTDSASLIEETKQNIASLLTATEQANTRIIDCESTIIESKKSILRNKNAYIASKSRIDKSIEKIEEQISTSDSIIKIIEMSQENINKQQDHIQEIIDDAHRASMAGSFRTRKEELDAPIHTSGLIMNWSLIGIGVISFILLYMSGITKDVFDWHAFATKLPVVAPLIWIAWANNKKHNYLMRIREDYAFKYASAMAFEGYKKQVQDTDPELEKRLLELAVENMGQNPIRLFDKKIQSTPINEFISNAGEALQTLRNPSSSIEKPDV